MLAAADCADSIGAPPVELEYAWNATSYGSLPESGGQLDQPAGLLKRMRAAENAYNVWSAYKKVSAKDLGIWIRNNKAAWHIVESILRMRRNS